MYPLRILVGGRGRGYRFKNSYDCQNSTEWDSDKVIKHGDVREVAGSRSRQVIINLVWAKPPDSVTINHRDLINDPFRGRVRLRYIVTKGYIHLTHLTRTPTLGIIITTHN